ncbi:MAG: DEAD/DEAH box helicase [Deltaproteobacteria bacterium]|nr:DEAD/DEAH box helicase [Deltaproteobacteria bacterium]
MSGGGRGDATAFATGGLLRRFSSRHGRLGHAFLKDRLAGASGYDRIAGYFRSSLFELAGEELASVGRVRVVCNADVDPADIHAAQAARDAALLERWNRADRDIDTLLDRPRYQALYDLLRRGNVEVRVVPAGDAPFLHGKAGVIRRPDGAATSFMGSLNETREGWDKNYELVWEDESADGVAFVQAEFDHLWERSVPLSDAVVAEIGRSARKRQVRVEDIPEDEVAPAALVEAPLYRQGEELKSWQRAFVALFLRHRQTYGKARLLLADEVGVGKTLSLAASALVACLLDDGPALVLCPANLCWQWQAEMSDKLGIPSAVWDSRSKVWVDPDGRVVRTRGPEDVVRCPYRIAIVSTGLVVQMTPEREALLGVRRLGTLILDEAHRARVERGLGGSGEPNNLLAFMRDLAPHAKNVLLGTATPIQTEQAQLWDLLDVLSRDVDHVLGRAGSPWRRPEVAIPILTGKKVIANGDEAWPFLRNPVPPRDEDAIFDHVRSDLDLAGDRFFTDHAVHDLPAATRETLADRLRDGRDGVPFLRLHNPVVRHVVIRRRRKLEDDGLLPRIGIDVWPNDAVPLPMFEGVALRTTHEFDLAYEAATRFADAVTHRKPGAAFLKGMILQRVCSSYAAGVATATRLLRQEPDDEDLAAEIGEIGDEAVHLSEMLRHLHARDADPKLAAVVHFLRERDWIRFGCIVFSQYYDTVERVATVLARQFPGQQVAVYAGGSRSAVLLGDERRAVEREQIKAAVRSRAIRLVVATDAACEGLNLQTLGTLVNVDLPWNPSRIEQRIGRIRRFGQARASVDMLNLVYQGTRDEEVYAAVSRRMKDRYDLLGSLPDVIEDDWIEEIERLDERLSEYTTKRKAADAFDVRYRDLAREDGPSWAECEKVLSRRDLVDLMSRGW